jgi:hypothetical protein
MEERIRFVKNCRSGLYEMSELCDRYGISRKTGYKWLHRFEAEGAGGLVDRSRAPLHCEHRMADSVREALLEVRRRHPTWGPRKLLVSSPTGDPRRIVLPSGAAQRRAIRLPHRLEHLLARRHAQPEERALRLPQAREQRQRKLDRGALRLAIPELRVTLRHGGSFVVGTPSVPYGR